MSVQAFKMLAAEVGEQTKQIQRLTDVVASMLETITDLLDAEQHWLEEEQRKKVVPVTMATDWGTIVRYEVHEDTWFVLHLDHDGMVLRRFFQDADGRRREATERDGVSYEPRG